MKTVLAFGTFDIVHKGHEYFLNKAKSYGDNLIVVIARDVNVKKIKGKLARHNENERLMQVIATNIPDEVTLGDLENHYDVLKTVMPDIICLGYDQNVFTDKLEDELKKINLLHTKIIRIDSYKPEIYKSSKMKAQNKS